MKYDVYHGRTASDPKFDLKYVGSDPSNDQYGPGFYFTDWESEAARYSDDGGVVIHASIEINKPLSDKHKLNKKEVEFMVRNAPEVAKVFDNMNDPNAMEEAFYETVTLSNIDEDFNRAYMKAISMHVGKPALDHMMLIWREHYRYDPAYYLKNLVALGYDGVIVPSEANLFVVFSPSQIDTLDVRKVGGESSVTESYHGDKYIKLLESFRISGDRDVVRIISLCESALIKTMGDSVISDMIDSVIENGYTNKLIGGRGDSTSLVDVDRDQLIAGIKVEMEHTIDPRIAMEIALDHLTEIDDYYTKLKTIDPHDDGIGVEKASGMIESDDREYRSTGKLLSQSNPMYNDRSIVSVYRARDASDVKFHDKDYVTLSPKFAIEHAENNHVYTEEPQIVIRAKIMANKLAAASNIDEWLYIGDDMDGDIAYVTKGPYEYENETLAREASKAKYSRISNLPLIEGIDYSMLRESPEGRLALGINSIYSGFRDVKNAIALSRFIYNEIDPPPLKLGTLLSLSYNKLVIIKEKADKLRKRDRLVDDNERERKNELKKERAYDILNKERNKELLSGDNELKGLQSDGILDGDGNYIADDDRYLIENVTNGDDGEVGGDIIAYHGTNKQFDRFEPSLGMQGVMWFSTDPSIIASGNSGASSSKYIMKVKLHLNKIANSNQYHKYGLWELKSMGYDGIRVTNEYYIVFDPENITMLDKNFIL